MLYGQIYSSEWVGVCSSPNQVNYAIAPPPRNQMVGPLEITSYEFKN